MPCYISNLPTHILHTIFFKLPIRTLTKCRYVCKSWRRIVSDPDFTKLLLSIRGPSNLIISLEEGNFRYLGNFGINFHDSEKYLHWLDFQGESRCFHFAAKPRWTYSHKKLDLINSCNGLCLFCLCGTAVDVHWNGGKTTMWVMNPITGEYIELPPLSERMHSKNEFCGLGYGNDSGRIKVVRIYFCRDDKGIQKNKMAEVCILGTGIWRRIIGAPPKYEVWESFNAFVNRSCHWLVRRSLNKISHTKICAFDFEIERFRLISLPPFDSGDKIWQKSSLGVSRGYLFYSCYYRLKTFWPGHFSEVWVMKKYGQKSSWFKMFVVEYYPMTPCYLNLVRRFQVMDILENGVVLVLCNDDFLLYNPETKTHTKVDTHRTLSGITEAFVHMKPNFTSLKDIVGGDNLEVLKDDETRNY